jgi:hypothetical protein
MQNANTLKIYATLKSGSSPERHINKVAVVIKGLAALHLLVIV